MSRVFSEVADSEATEGDIGSADELPPLPSPQQEEQESAEQIGRRRIEAEKEAERLALASRFASMIETGAAVATDSFSVDSANAVIAAPVATTSRSGLTRILGESGILGSGSGVATTTTAASTTTRRRKREILGRAISNVSAASSGSADSVIGPGLGSSTNLASEGGGSKRVGSGVTATAAAESGGDTAGALPAPVANMTSTTTSGGLREDPIVTSVSDTDNNAPEDTVSDNKPAAAQQEEEKTPSTQLEYNDPEANRNRARLMHKMRGVAGSGAGTGAGSDGTSLSRGGSFTEEKPEGKLTLADLGGYDMSVQKGEYSSGTTSRRVTRRRG